MGNHSEEKRESALLEIGTEVHPWFQRDEVIELEIDGIGVLRNRIV